MPERTAYWASRKTLLAADVHLGKAASFQAAGIPIPLGESEQSLGRLTSALGRTGAERLILLGDLWHAKTGMTDRTLDEFELWKLRFPDLEVILVQGNHDRRVGKLARSLPFSEVVGTFDESVFRFCHEPCESEAYMLCGHLHPAVTLVGPGRQHHTFPCFWFRETQAVFPAVGTFTGVCPVRPMESERVFIVHDGRVTKV